MSQNKSITSKLVNAAAHHSCHELFKDNFQTSLQQDSSFFFLKSSRDNFKKFQRHNSSIMSQKQSKTTLTLFLASFPQFCLEFVVGQFKTLPEPQFNILVTKILKTTSKLAFASLCRFGFELFG